MAALALTPRTAVVHRLMSLTGVVAAGAFLIVHAAINASALWGTAALTGAADAVQRLPGLAAVEVVFVFLPLAVHAIIGLGLVVSGAPLAFDRPYPRAVGRAMRITGVVGFAFLAVHLLEFRFRDRAMQFAGSELATLLSRDLSATSLGVPWRGVLYVLAAACLAFHFSAGAWAFAVGGRPAARRASRWILVAFGTLGGALWLVFVAAIVFHATGAHPFRGAGELDATGDSPCPPATVAP